MGAGAVWRRLWRGVPGNSSYPASGYRTRDMAGGAAAMAGAAATPSAPHTPAALILRGWWRERIWLALRLIRVRLTIRQRRGRRRDSLRWIQHALRGSDGRGRSSTRHCGNNRGWHGHNPFRNSRTNRNLPQPTGFGGYTGPRIIPNPFDNTLLVQGTPEQWEQIRDWSRNWTFRLARSLIDAKIYEIDLTGISLWASNPICRARRHEPDGRRNAGPGLQ